MLRFGEGLFCFFEKAFGLVALHLICGGWRWAFCTVSWFAGCKVMSLTFPSRRFSVPNKTQ
jgi:hypothetical protein